MRYIKAFAFLLIVATAGVWLFRPVSTNAGNETNVVEPNPSVFNILLLGCDASGVRPDSILLVHVDGGRGQVDLLSLPRDSKVYFDGGYHKLNSVLGLCGKEAMNQTVENLTGVTVDYYIRLNGGTFAQLVDALGGVEYEVEKDMYYRDSAQGLYINIKKGKQTLDGEQCEQYCRYRLYAMGDITRTQHQQKLLSELLRQKLKLQYVTKLPALYNILKDNAETDITVTDIVSYLPLARSMSEKGVVINCHQCPGEYNDMKREKVSYYLIDKTKLQQLCHNNFSSK